MKTLNQIEFHASKDPKAQESHMQPMPIRQQVIYLEVAEVPNSNLIMSQTIGFVTINFKQSKRKPPRQYSHIKHLLKMLCHVYMTVLFPLMHTPLLENSDDTTR